MNDETNSQECSEVDKQKKCNKCMMGIVKAQKQKTRSKTSIQRMSAMSSIVELYSLCVNLMNTTTSIMVIEIMRTTSAQAFVNHWFAYKFVSFQIEELWGNGTGSWNGVGTFLVLSNLS